MQNVLLVSLNEDQKEIITRILAGHFLVISCATVKEASSYLDSGMAPRIWVLIDLNSQADWELFIPSLKERG